MKASPIPIVFIFAIALLCASSRVSAIQIAYDGFESGTAGAGLTGDSGGTGWTTDWTAVSGVNVQSASLSYSSGSVNIDGGSLTGEVDGATINTDAAHRTFAAQTGTTYMSLLFRAEAGLEDSDFMHFMFNNDAVNTNSGGFGMLSTDTLRLGARIGTTNGGTTTSSSTDIVADTTYFLVAKISKDGSTNYNTLELFINPDSLTEPALADATDTADSGFSSFSFFTLRTFNFDSGDIYQFDELRIGTTFADVIPEPGTGALLALGGFAFAIRRRRR